MATYKMQRKRGDFGIVPVKVLEALVLNSREDIGAAYRRLDYCHQFAPGGLSQFHTSVRDYLTGQGLTASEARTVADHVCGPKPAKHNPRGRDFYLTPSGGPLPAAYGDNEAAWNANYALLNRMLAQVKRRTSPAGYAAIHGAL